MLGATFRKLKAGLSISCEIHSGIGDQHQRTRNVSYLFAFHIFIIQRLLLQGGEVRKSPRLNLHGVDRDSLYLYIH